MQSYGIEVNVTDPQAQANDAIREYGIRLVDWDELPLADAIVAAVSHREFTARPVSDFVRKLVKNGTFIDVKASFDAEALRAAGIRVWRL